VRAPGARAAHHRLGIGELSYHDLAADSALSPKIFVFFFADLPQVFRIACRSLQKPADARRGESNLHRAKDASGSCEAAHGLQRPQH